MSPKPVVGQMRNVLLCAAVMIGQVVAVAGMYYLRIAGSHPSAESDIVIFYLPTLGAFTLYAAVFGSWNKGRAAVSRAGRLIASLGLAFLGLFVAMLTALNTWGS